MTSNTYREELECNIQAVKAVFRRDVKVFWKDIRGNLIRVLGQPLFFLLVFGFLMPEMRIFRADYTQILIPGVVAMATLMGSIRSTAAEVGISFDHDEEIRAHILLPLTMRSLALEKIFFGMLQGLFSAFSMIIISSVVFPGLFTLSVFNVVMTLLVVIAGGLIFAALGLAIGSTFQPPEIMFEVMFIIMMPMMFFGATFYPVELIGQIHPILRYLTLAVPLAHVSELVRTFLTGGGYFSPFIYGVGIIFFMAVCIPLGILGFKRRAIS